MTEEQYERLLKLMRSAALSLRKIILEQAKKAAPGDPELQAKLTRFPWEAK